MNRIQFAGYLRHTLIPDFRAADMDATAGDFDTALQFLTGDMEALHDARKALLAASAHLVPTTNAAALVAASLKELDGILGYPAPVKIPPSTQAQPCVQHHRCMEDRSHLKD